MTDETPIEARTPMGRAYPKGRLWEEPPGEADEARR